jgi:hypothetical protein
VVVILWDFEEGCSTPFLQHLRELVETMSMEMHARLTPFGVGVMSR